jgi:hypothetical protein
VDIEEMGQTDSTVKKLSIIFALMGDKELPSFLQKWHQGRTSPTD